MKANEDEIPFEPESASTDVKSHSAQKAVNQIKRDVTRYLELVPDIKFGKTVDITFNIAFPLSHSSADSSILLKDDFLACNGERLLQKMGIKMKLGKVGSFGAL